MPDDPRESLIKFSYVTERRLIDSNLFFISQENFLLSLREIQKEFYPERTLSVKIAALREGSFEVKYVFELIDELLPLAPALVTIGNWEAIKNIFQQLKLILNIREIVRDKKPQIVKEGDNFTIIGDKNQITVSKNVFNLNAKNDVLDRAIRQSFGTINGDPDVRAIEVTSNEAKLLEVRRESFAAVSVGNPYLDESRSVRMIDETIVIAKAVLNTDKKWKWSFIFQGRFINAPILDKAFNDRVQRGELRFGHGDALKAKLRIENRLDEDLGVFVESKIEVIEVFEIIPRAVQLPMSSGNSS